MQQACAVVAASEAASWLERHELEDDFHGLLVYEGARLHLSDNQFRDNDTFDVDPVHGTYLAFGVFSRGVSVLQRSEQGLELLADQLSDAVRVGAVNRIELRPSGTDVAVYVNDRSVLTLEATNAFRGAVGIIAIGSGTFTFRDLVIDARE